LIAATNRDLKAEVEAGRFRADLYYRLAVFPIEIPPLRARSEDVPSLAAHFLGQACRRLGMVERSLNRRQVEALQGYSWPGNIRELQNVIERAAITSRTGPLRFELPSAPAPQVLGASGVSSRPGVGDVGAGGALLRYRELEELELANLVEALRRTSWKVSGSGGAAELLGIKPTTLASRIKALGLRRPV
jgi:transcriptional regulator with GAF, ATPase, and Fis domain